jgi:hypothetical protein
MPDSLFRVTNEDTTGVSGEAAAPEAPPQR